MELVKTILDNDLLSLKAYCDQNIQKHIDARISSKKVEVLAKINNTSIDKMTELMATSQA